MYAIVKTGGKQYRVERGQSLLVERLAADDGATVALEPLLYVDGSDVLDGGDLAKVNVSARVLGHERGPKLRVVKFKPKRGYKRRTGHRQELTRIEVTEIKLKSGRSKSAGRQAAAQTADREAAAAQTADREAAAQTADREAAAAQTADREAAAAQTADREAAAAQTADRGAVAHPVDKEAEDGT